MSIRVRTLEELIEKLDSDAQWRKKEIADMRSYCQEKNNPDSLLRASFVLCCAHFEGSIRYSANAYIAYISSQGYTGRELRVEIPSIVIRKKKHHLFGQLSTNKVRVSVVSDIVSEYDALLDNRFYIKLNEEDLIPEIDEDDIPLPTEGNPAPDVLAEISKVLGLDYDDLFQLREPFINFELLKPRHSVAHGERRPITVDELDAAASFVVEIIDKFKDSIVDAAESNRHLRSRT